MLKKLKTFEKLLVLRKREDLTKKRVWFKGDKYVGAKKLKIGELLQNLGVSWTQDTDFINI